MGDVTWSGATDGNWNTGTNWVGGAAPTGGDVAIFDGTSGRDVTTGPSSAINITIRVTPKYTGSWRVPVVLGTVTLFEFAGSGAAYDLSATVTTCRAQIKSGVTLTASGGTWTNTYANGDAGGLLYVNGATLTNKYCTGVTVRESSGGSASTITQVTSLSYTSAKNPGTLTADGHSSVTVTGTAAVTAAVCHPSVTYNHQSSGTVSALTLKPGAQYPNIGAVSHTISQLNYWPNSYINENPPGATITISARTSFGYQDGSAPPITR